jgi:iron complex outermembrane receptor protein
LIPATPHSSPASKNTWKINPSYQYSPDQYVYAIWSQGFRRGGANSVPFTGIYQESPKLESYAPDSVNNYEAELYLCGL